MSDRWILTKRYLGHVFRHWRAFLSMVGCMIVVGLLEPMLVWLIAPLLDATAHPNSAPVADDFIAHAKATLLSPDILPFAMVTLVVILACFSYLRSYLGGWLDATLQRDFRIIMAKHLLRLPAHQLQDDSMGRITARFMSFLPTLTGSVMPITMAVIQESVKITSYLGWMLYLNWQLTLIVLISSPLIVLNIHLLSKRIGKVTETAQHYTAASQNRLNETVQLWPIIKIQGGDEAQRWLNHVFSRLRGATIRTESILAAGQPLARIIIVIPCGFVIAYLLGALAHGNMSAGEVGSFVTTMIILQIPVRNITRAMNLWEQMLVAAREIFSFLDSPPEEDSGTQRLSQVRGEIVFHHVYFRYPTSDKDILHDICLTIRPGETIAIVGHSGAGKTSLTKLLSRFFLPQNGHIAIDGVNVQHLTLESLRTHLSLVTQEPLLFSDSVGANVAYPDKVADHSDKIKQALRHACADFVDTLPEGIYTDIGSAGELLSGGQKQRLALARAFYRDSPIIILDEATSALDARTEAQVKQATQRLLAGKTALIIAHRFSTIDYADRIVVMEEGKIIAADTKDVLLRTCPAFVTLYNAQLLHNSSAQGIN